MKLLGVLLILGVTNVARAVSPSADIQDPAAEDNNEVLWQVLYAKLNTLLNVTEVLSQSISELQQRVADQENLIRKSFNHSQTWTSILRRQDGSVDFFRPWEDYRKGFGSPNGEFFIGLDKLHIMTTYGAPQELLVVLMDWEGETRYAKYDLFQIASEQEKYALKELGLYSGNAGDSLSHHKGMNFSTKDQDNDESVNTNCAVHYSGAWWFKTCYKCHLNGLYRAKTEEPTEGVAWNGWKDWYSLKFAEMMIRPKL